MSALEVAGQVLLQRLLPRKPLAAAPAHEGPRHLLAATIAMHELHVLLERRRVHELGAAEGTHLVLGAAVALLVQRQVARLRKKRLAAKLKSVTRLMAMAKSPTSARR